MKPVNSLLRPAQLAFLLTAISPQLSTSLAQGTITPPGTPAPTMKSLDQVEPRIPIDAFHTPGDASSAYIISNTGSYYLITNLVPVGGKGYIIIKANNVSIDLGGSHYWGSRRPRLESRCPIFKPTLLCATEWSAGSTRTVLTV
jgi:hypothetical protein